jgi:hypothetical protein
MIARDLDDSRTILIKQEDHADAAGFFAAHWGNKSIQRSDQHRSLVHAAIYHDTHYKEIEALPPIEQAQGRPYGHRNLPFATWHIDALLKNLSWISDWDPYAGLLVSMHHTGLPQNRYGVIRSWRDGQGASGGGRSLRPEFAAAIKDMEAKQRALVDEQDAGAKTLQWFNYRLLQTFDLLSLYVCCDGYDNGGMRETWLGPVPLANGSNEEVNIRLLPQGEGRIRVDPYPFDKNELKVSIPARVISKQMGSSDDAIRLSYLAATRETLSWVFHS